MNIKQMIELAEMKQLESFQHDRLVDIYSGNLNKYVRDSLSRELSPSSFEIAKTRIPAINIIEKLTKKLSKVYSENPKRTTADIDKDFLDWASNTIDVNGVMSEAETILNLNRSFLLEPYADGDKWSVRVIAPSKFCVYSDDIVNPNKPTHVIKFMGSQSITSGKETTNSNVYWIYDAFFITKINSRGDILEVIPNDFGVLPFVYVKSNPFVLQPSPDNDSYDNALIAPKLLTDLNYAIRFQSHSLVYGMDLNIEKNITANADSFLNLKSDTSNANAKPSIGVISPTVQASNVIDTVKFQVSQWLDSKGIKVSASGQTGSTDAVSAVSKIVDEADASAIIQSNRLLLIKAEKDLWKLLGKFQSLSKMSGFQKGVSDSFDVSISFPVQQIVKDPSAIREDVKFQLDNGLTTFKMALQRVHPDLNETEIDALIVEIEEEKQSKQDQVKETVVSNTQDLGNNLDNANDNSSNDNLGKQ